MMDLDNEHALGLGVQIMRPQVDAAVLKCAQDCTISEEIRLVDDVFPSRHGAVRAEHLQLGDYSQRKAVRRDKRFSGPPPGVQAKHSNGSRPRHCDLQIKPVLVFCSFLLLFSSTYPLLQINILHRIFVQVIRVSVCLKLRNACRVPSMLLAKVYTYLNAARLDRIV